LDIAALNALQSRQHECENLAVMMHVCLVVSRWKSKKVEQQNEFRRPIKTNLRRGGSKYLSKSLSIL